MKTVYRFFVYFAVRRELEDIDSLMTGESYSFLPLAVNGLVRKRIIVLKIK